MRTGGLGSFGLWPTYRQKFLNSNMVMHLNVSSNATNRFSMLLNANHFVKLSDADTFRNTYLGFIRAMTSLGDETKDLLSKIFELESEI